MAEETSIPWIERLNMISINPHAATIEDIARMATELSDFNFDELEPWGSTSGESGLVDNYLVPGQSAVRLRHTLSGKTGYVILSYPDHPEVS